MSIKFLSGVNVDSNTLVVDAVNNRVGINNASPTAALHIVTGGSTQIRLQHDSWNYWDITSAYNTTNADLYFSMAGAEKFRINASGNVGIGTTSPAQKLAVVGTSDIVSYSNGTTTGYLYSDANGIGLFNGATGSGTGIYARTSNILDFYYGSSIGIRLSSTGNVGIGTTSPVTNLDVNGSINIANGNNLTWGGAYGAGIPTIAAAGGGIYFYPAGSTSGATMRITNTGDVGIGTTSPSTKLHVSGGARITGGLDLNSGARITGAYYENSNTEFTYIDMYNPGNASINIGTKHPLSYISFESGNGAYTERMRITNTGNVGIGTTSPNVALEVSGASNLSSRIRAAKTSSGTIEMGADRDTFGSPYISAITNSNLDFFTNDTHRIRITNAGNVIINGTTAINSASNRGNLTINGTSAILNFGISNVESGYIYHNGTNLDISQVLAQPLRFLTTNSERMRITSGGNVFFGATSAVSFETFGVAHQWSRFYTTSATDYALIDVGNATTRVRIGVDSSTGGSLATGTSAYASYIGSSGAYPLQLGSYGGVAITVNSSNNVGIGTTSPGAKLHVAGSTYIRNDNSTNQLTIDNDSVGSNAAPQYSDVLFGGYSSALRARIRGIDRASNLTRGGIILQASPEGTTLVDRLFLDGNGESYFYNNSAEVMRITSAGNVGIGTTSPENLLHVDGDTGSDDYQLQVSNRNAAGGAGLIIDRTLNSRAAQIQYSTAGVASWYQGILRNGGNAHSNFYIGTGSDVNVTTPALTILSGGNVGIGTTSPSYKLDVNGDINLPFGTSNGYRINGNRILSQGSGFFEFGALDYKSTYPNISTNSDGTFRIQSNGSTLVTVNQSGNVGIGTTSPNSKLEVFDGDISVTTSGSFSFLNLNRNFIPDSSGVLLGGIKYRGYSTGTTYQSGAYIYSYASAAWTSTSSPGYLSIQTTPSGSTTPVERMLVASNGALKLNAYGSGSNTGTATQRLAVDASGNVIEIPIGSGPVDGNGTANYVTKWSDSDTITNSIIYDNGTNVGIGTTSPAATLDVVSSGSIQTSILARGQDANFRLVSRQDKSSNDSGAIVGEFGVDWTTTRNSAIRFHRGGDVTGGFMTFTTNDGSERMRITSAGNVGIGTTSPSQKLHVVGVGRFDNIGAQLVLGTSGVAGAYEFSTTTGNALVISLSGVNERMRIDASGNVGIGTASPSRLFDVSAVNPQMTLKSTTTTGFSEYYFSDSAGDPGYLSYAHNGDYLAIGVNSAERMRITSAGNVGIGTTTPTSILDASLSGGATSGFRFKGWSDASTPYLLSLGTETYQDIFQIKSVNGLVTMGIVGAVGSTPDLAFQTNSIERLRITSAGNVGIGTTAPDEALEVRGANKGLALTRDASTGSSRIYYRTSGTYLWSLGIRANSDNYSIFDEVLGSERFTILKSNGNVGIGTTSPSYKLQVNSDAGGYGIVNTNGTVTIGTYIEGSNNYASFGTQSNHGLGFFTNNAAPHMYINTSGNVGIGTTAPLQTSANRVVTTINGPTSAILNLGVGGVLASYYFADAGGSTLETVGTNTIAANGANIIQLTTNGSERLRITAAGSVFINSTSMDGKLGINTATSVAYNPNAYNGVNASIRLTNGSAGVNRYTGIAFGGGGSTEAFIGSVQNASELAEIVFQTFNGSAYGERARITSGGNVGIGTTSPASLLQVVGASLESQGVLNISNTHASGGVYYPAAKIRNTRGDHSYGIISEFSIGTVGGSDRPSILFYSDAAAHSWTVGQVTAAWGSADSFGIGYRANNVPSTFTGWPSNYFTITTAGNVGIGATGPSEKLHVDGSTLITYNNSFQSTNSVGNKAILARVSPTSGIVNYAEYATATNLNGFVIGSDDARVKGNITGDSLEFITNTSTRMTVLSSGNVGINTTTPGSTLHVVGDVLIQTGALGVGVNPDPTDGRIDASNDIVAFNSSDRRLKENITPIANALEKVRSLTGVEFDWKEETKKAHGHSGRDTGVIAQEVQAIMPTAVRTNNTGYLAVRYEKLIGLLIEGMKEQQAQIDELKAQINDSSR